MRKIHSVCVYCASSSQIDPVYFKAAEELGKLIVQNNMRCIYGAGNQGLMGTIADSILDAGGKITGIIPQFMYEEGWHNKRLQDIEITGSMHERKERMATLSDAVIALPGGCGTMEELLEIITWKQLGLYFNPIIILNTAGYYDPLLSLLEKAIDQNFMHSEHLKMWVVVSTPQEAINALFSAPEWNGSVRKFAAI